MPTQHGPDAKPDRRRTRNRTEDTPEVRPLWWEPYFASLAKIGVRWAACKAAQIDPSTPMVYIGRHPDLKKEFEERTRLAMEDATDLLEEEAVRRARDGWEEPVFYQGRECGTIRRFDSTLLIFLLKANRPEKFRERSEVFSLTLDQLERLNLSDEELDALERGEDIRRILRARSAPATSE